MMSSYGPTPVTRFSSTYQTSTNPYTAKIKKNKFDPIRSAIDTRYSSYQNLRQSRAQSSLSSVRIKRIRPSKVSKISYKHRTKKATKRLDILNTNKISDAKIKSRQTRIQTMVNLKRAKIVKKRRRNYLSNKLENKLKRTGEGAIKHQVQKVEKERRLKLYRHWQSKWLEVIIFFKFLRKAQHSMSNMYDMVNVFSATVKIQRFWRIRNCNLKMNHLTICQKIHFAWGARMLKRKVARLRRAKKAKFIIDYLILEKVRKKMRIAVGTRISKIRE